MCNRPKLTKLVMEVIISVKLNTRKDLPIERGAKHIASDQETDSSLETSDDDDMVRCEEICRLLYGENGEGKTTTGR